MTDWAVTVKGGRVFATPTLTDDEEAALEAAWENDPTKSKSRYYKFRRAMLDALPGRTEALEAAGFRYGKSHWCGGTAVLYSPEEWGRWDKANPACTVPNEIQAGSGRLSLPTHVYDALATILTEAARQEDAEAVTAS